MRINTTPMSVTLFLAGLFAATACDEENPESDLAESPSSLLYDPARAPVRNYGTPPMVPVCWQNRADISSTRRAWAEESVSQWERYGRVNFTGWSSTQNCPSNWNGVEIDITRRGAWYAGGYPNWQSDPMIFNVYFDDQPSSTWPDGCVVHNEQCIRSLALHEFGHTLGFFHENERPSHEGETVPCTWDEFEGLSSNAVEYGEYDTLSVMDICSQPMGDAPSWKTEPSPRDIASLQRVWGRRIPGSVVSPRGNCAAVVTANGNGSNVFLWTCDEYLDDQEFRLAASDNDHYRLKVKRGSSSWCMAPEDTSSPASGDNVVMKTCSNSTDWVFENVEIRGWGGLCLDLTNGNTANNTNIRIKTCDGSVRQKWSLDREGRIHYGNLSSNKCARAKDGNLYLYTCQSSWNSQKFNLLAGGQLESKYEPGKCWDVSGASDYQYRHGQGGPYSGENVGLFDCNSSLNQRFNFSGQIRLGANKNLCLDRKNAGDKDGTGIWLYNCNATSAQIWDYYF